ncbi:MAG: transcription elongation factor Spt5 [Nanoarchaeota archaeon]|nr:transcription elongation factor Spt5 [Nanoarchaeota archaeon]
MVDEEQKVEVVPEEQKAKENYETENDAEDTEESGAVKEAVEAEAVEEVTESEEAQKEDKEEKEAAEGELESSHIFALRTTANREDQVMDFVTSNASKKKLEVYSVIRPHGMRGYIFLEAAARGDAEQAAFGVPYARGILPNEIQYAEIEHMLEQAKVEYNIKKNDIVEIISGAFKREQAKVTRMDKGKEEVVVELLQAAVPIPITLKMDTVKVIRREGEEDDDME